jgi:hypothetical protein
VMEPVWGGPWPLLLGVPGAEELETLLLPLVDRAVPDRVPTVLSEDRHAPPPTALHVRVPLRASAQGVPPLGHRTLTLRGGDRGGGGGEGEGGGVGGAGGRCKRGYVEHRAAVYRR